MVSVSDLSTSTVRLKIANILSTRPATLSELADATGISVQGVLKHLKKLADVGILEEKEMRGGKYLRGRKLYHLNGRKVADYSEGDLLVATLGRASEEGPVRVKDAYQELDWLAQDIVILRRRARELSQRMRRMLDEVTEDESRMGALIEGLDLSQEEQQIAYLIFAEHTPENARKTLRDHYGCVDPDAAMRSVSAKIRRPRS